MDPIPQARGDVNRLSFGCPSTPVTAQSWLERGPAGQVRAEQAAPASTRNSVHLPATSRVTRAGARAPSAGARESLIREVCKELGPVGAAPRAPRTFRLPVPPFPTKGTLVWVQGASWWSEKVVQPSQPSRVPSRWWVNQSSQKLRFLY